MINHILSSGFTFFILFVLKQILYNYVKFKILPCHESPTNKTKLFSYSIFSTLCIKWLVSYFHTIYMQCYSGGYIRWYTPYIFWSLRINTVYLLLYKYIIITINIIISKKYLIKKSFVFILICLQYSVFICTLYTKTPNGDWL